MVSLNFLEKQKKYANEVAFGKSAKRKQAIVR